MPRPSDRRVLMVSIRYRMKSRQLCKLHIKYLQFCIRHSRLRAAGLGTRFWRNARAALGGARAAPGDVLGAGEVPGGEMGKEAAPVG